MKAIKIHAGQEWFSLHSPQKFTIKDMDTTFPQSGVCTIIIERKIPKKGIELRERELTPEQFEELARLYAPREEKAKKGKV